jgi:hypothetical protein
MWRIYSNPDPHGVVLCKDYKQLVVGRKSMVSKVDYNQFYVPTLVSFHNISFSLGMFWRFEGWNCTRQPWDIYTGRECCFNCQIFQSIISWTTEWQIWCIGMGSNMEHVVLIKCVMIILMDHINDDIDGTHYTWVKWCFRDLILDMKLISYQFIFIV